MKSVIEIQGAEYECKIRSEALPVLAHFPRNGAATTVACLPVCRLA
jgi:hypothetical protein